MPNRIIKESIKFSEEIDKLSWFEEVVFYRILVTADDYGCLDGRSVLLKNELFPLKENVTKKAIEDAIARLASVGLLHAYEVSGKPYLALPTWERHQRVRNKHRKYPSSDDGKRLSANRGQMTADCLPESESESESNPNPKQNPNTRETRDDCGCDTVEAYVAANLRHMSPGNLEELSGLMETFPGDVIRYAVDVAVGRGACTWAYTRAILAKWLERGVKTLGDAKADSVAHSKKTTQSPSNPALNYEQHTYTMDDFKGLFVDLGAYSDGEDDKRDEA